MVSPDSDSRIPIGVSGIVLITNHDILTRGDLADAADVIARFYGKERVLNRPRPRTAHFFGHSKGDFE
jgi:hypothetical protein